jgi:hypothetical protein
MVVKPISGDDVPTRNSWTFFHMDAPGDTSSSVNIVDFSLNGPRNSYDEFPHEGSSMPTLGGFEYFKTERIPLDEYH